MSRVDTRDITIFIDHFQMGQTSQLSEIQKALKDMALSCTTSFRLTLSNFGSQ